MPAASIEVRGDPPRGVAVDQFSLPLANDERVVRGRAEFHAAFSDLARGKRNWQIACFLSLGISVVLASGVVGLASRSRLVPYVVEVDRLGRARAFGSAEQMAAVDRRVVVAQLAGFVRDIRTVLADPAAQADLVRRAYAFVDRGAAPFLSEYYADPVNDPRQLGRDLTRLVEVTSVLPVPGGGAAGGTATWKVGWVESIYPRTPGASRSDVAWEGYLTTRVVPPATLDRITINPVGLYVTSIAWTQVGTRVPHDSVPAVAREVSP